MSVFTIKATHGSEAFRKAAEQGRPGMIARQATAAHPGALTDFFVFESVEDAIGHPSTTRTA